MRTRDTAQLCELVGGDPQALYDVDVGNIVVSDHNNHCIQVLRYSDGAILRSFGRVGKAGDGPVSLRNPCAFAIANGLIIVADYGNHRVQVLNYATGEFVRSLRSSGTSSCVAIARS